MIKRIKNTFLTEKFIKYFISGIIGFIVDTFFLNFFKYGVKIYDYKVFNLLDYSKFLASIIGAFVSFFLNRNWSFKAKAGKIRNQGLRMAIVFVANIFVASLIFTFYYEVLKLILNGTFETLLPTAANFMTEGTRMFLNYFVYKNFVFKL